MASNSSTTFHRLNVLGVTQSHKTWVRTMEDIGAGLVSKIRKLRQDGHELRINFDNLDYKILANHVSTNHQNTDIHWINQYITFDRVIASQLDDSKPIADLKDLPLSIYMLTEDERRQHKSNLIVLVARVLTQKIPCLSSLADAVPKHIQHPYSKEMSTKSVLINLPVQPFNQAKHADVIQYLDYLESLLVQIYSPTGSTFGNGTDDKHRMQDQILNGVKVPLGGDQLGRERVTGAKKLRLGCDSASARLEHIEEMPELWHTKQAFLGLIWEKLYSTNSGRDVGTLFHFRQKFSKTNVPAQVKKNYAGAEALLLQVTRAHICEAFLTWAKMDDIESQPSSLTIPPVSTTNEKKLAFIEKEIGAFVDEYVVADQGFQNRWELLSNGTSGQAVNNHSEAKGDDHVQNYAKQLIQMGIFLINLNDTEKEGDGNRSVINWKILMLYFRARKRGQKYAYEALRFLSHVKALYTRRMAHRCIHGRFVNYRGGQGRNVANDLKQEHFVKKTKKLVKALGAQKTFKAVNRVTSAAHGIDEIIINIDEQCILHQDSSKHSIASASDEELKMVRVLRCLRPFSFNPGRKHAHFPAMSKSTLDCIEPTILKEWLGRHKKRLAFNRNTNYESEEVICDNGEGDDSDSDTEITLELDNASDTEDDI